VADSPARPVSGPLIRVPKLHQFRIEQEGSHVRLLVDGRLVFDADWRGAERVGGEILLKSKKAKEHALGLTNRP